MPAVNYDLMLQEMLTPTDGEVEPDHLLGPAARLAQPDADAEPRHALFHGVLRHEGRGSDRDRGPAGGDDGSLNGNIVTAWQKPLEDVGLLGVDKGKGGKFVILPPGLRGAGARGLHPRCRPTRYGGLRADPLEPAEPRARATSRSRSPTASGSRSIPCRRPGNPPATVFTDVQDVTVRFHHPLRRELLRAARPHRADRALARARPRDDRSAEDARHREGQAVYPDHPPKGALDEGVAKPRALAARYDAGLPPFFEGSHWTSRRRRNWSRLQPTALRIRINTQSMRAASRITMRT